MCAVYLHHVHLQESYAMLNKHEVPVVREEVERCDTLRYSWRLLQAKAVEMSSHLVELQPRYRQELINNVGTFITDCDQFYASYNSVSLIIIFSMSLLLFLDFVCTVCQYYSHLQLSCKYCPGLSYTNR